MQVETVPIASLTEDPANLRIHPDRNIEGIKGSLARFGQQKPIIVGPNNVVIAGNGCLRAARELGWTEIKVVRSPLNGVELTAFGLADNRTAETSEWDIEGLSKLFQAMKADMVPLEGLGWEDYELEPLLKAEWKPPELDEENLFEESSAGKDGDGATEGRDGDRAIAFTPEEFEQIEFATKLQREKLGTDGAELSTGALLAIICSDWSEDEATPQTEDRSEG